MIFCLHVCACYQKRLKRVLGPPEVELQMIVSFHVSAQIHQPRSSAKAAYAFNH